MTGLIDFLTDAASNDVSAPPILWQEGQPAGTVNNSAREMMAALARWHIDNSGGLGTSGAASGAITLSTQQGVSTAALARGFSLSFQTDAASNGPSTLNADGTGAKPLRRVGNIELAPGDLQIGVPYRVIWLPNLGAYTLVSPDIVRPGRVVAFATEGAIPAGWVPCDGRTLSRTAYAALFQFIGGTFGAPDGNTFQVPDLRGRTLFGQDAGAGRLTGAGGLGGNLASTGGSEAVSLNEAQLAAHTHGGSTGGAGGHNHGGATTGAGGHDHGGATGGAGGHTHTGTTEGGGSHSHTGTTDNGGLHSHGVGYLRLTNYRTDGASSGVASLDAGGGPGTVNTTGITDGNGAHSHSLTTTGIGDHQHSFTTNGVSNHAHGIAGVGDHAHGIADVGDHTHSLSLASAGAGQGHSNIPPGLVAVFAIKA